MSSFFKEVCLFSIRILKESSTGILFINSTDIFFISVTPVNTTCSIGINLKIYLISQGTSFSFSRKKNIKSTGFLKQTPTTSPSMLVVRMVACKSPNSANNSPSSSISASSLYLKVVAIKLNSTIYHFFFLLGKFFYNCINLFF